MAISAPHYQLFISLKPILPRGGRLLEIGEANWYGDVPPSELSWLFADDDRRVHEDLAAAFDKPDLFDIAKRFYRALFAPSVIVSIDFNGTPAALKLDLNAPLSGQRNGGDGSTVEIRGQFDLCINHGTAEHIFNIAQVFRTIHDHTVDGGLMIHESPFTGWVDHGFYCLQPTLFYDLAAANNYEIVLAAIEHIDTDTTIRLESRDHAAELAKSGKLPNNSMLYVVYRKLGDGPFKIPMQGYYNQTLSPQGRKAWEELR
jgi:hypothetical protein